MKYQTKIKIAGKELTSLTSEKSYIRDVELSDCVSNKVLDIGATGASRLSVTIVNPESASYDGEDVEFWVSPIDDGIKTRAEQIIDEVGDTAGTDVVVSDPVEIDSTEDEGDEGEPMTADEEAQLETEVEAENKSAFEILEGVSEQIETETTESETEEEWTKLGIFTVYSQTDFNGQIRLVCYDKFALMNDTYIPSVIRDTIQNLFKDYCSQLRAKGIEIDSGIEMPIDTITWLTYSSFREAVGYFAGLCGGYADFDEDGVLNINQYAPSGIELVKEELISITGTSGGDVDVTGFECGGIVAGDIASMSFNNPFMTQEILDDIYADYKGLRLSGQKFTAMWTPAMQAGTFVRLMSEEEYRAYLKLKNHAEQNGTTAEIIADLNSMGDIIQITSQTISFNGDATTQINSALLTVTATENPSVEPVKNLATTAREMADSANETATQAKDTAQAVEGIATEAKTSATNAQNIANEASAAAETANNNAIAAQESADEAAKSATDYISNNTTVENAIFVHSKGDSQNGVYIDNDSVDIVKGNLKIASFGEKTTVGDESNTHTKIGAGYMDIINPSVNTLGAGGKIAHFGVGDTFDENGDVVQGIYSTLGVRGRPYSTEQPEGCGLYSLVEGYGNYGGGAQSHAEGKQTSAKGAHSHAEGQLTRAYGVDSHAEGSLTKAKGNRSHAEGSGTEAIGAQSHAEGTGTIAIGATQHVEGKFNVEDSENKYAHIIGNGTSTSARSNAMTVDWNGNLEVAGTITVGKTTEPIGTTKSATLSSNTSLSTSYKALVSLNLTKGIWVIFGRLRSSSTLSSGSTTYANISTSSANNWVASSHYGGSGGYKGHELSRVYVLTEDTTVYLNARTYSGTITLGTETVLQAVKIA